jgi:hypothetical protein
VAVLLVASLEAATSPVAAQGAQATPVVFRSVHGKLESVDVQLNGVVMVSDDGQRMAWQFDKAVIAKLEGFKPGDPVVVIYRQRGTGKAVTALAFPGAAATPVYVNTSGQRVDLVSGPMVDGACGKPAEASIHRTTIPVGGRAETSDACWCCASAGEACTPANKTGLGQAFLVHCYP